MVFELPIFKLLQVILASDHVIDKLSNLLMKLHHVWFSMDEVLDFAPFFK